MKQEQQPYAELGSRIKQARRAMGFSQKDLMNKASFSQASLSAWENGDYVPNPENLRKLADKLNLETGELAALIADIERRGEEDESASFVSNSLKIARDMFGDNTRVVLVAPTGLPIMDSDAVKDLWADNICRGVDYEVIWFTDELERAYIDEGHSVEMKRMRDFLNAIDIVERKIDERAEHGKHRIGCIKHYAVSSVMRGASQTVALSEREHDAQRHVEKLLRALDSTTRPRNSVFRLSSEDLAKLRVEDAKHLIDDFARNRRNKLMDRLEDATDPESCEKFIREVSRIAIGWGNSSAVEREIYKLKSFWTRHSSLVIHISKGDGDSYLQEIAYERPAARHRVFENVDTHEEPPKRNYVWFDYGEAKTLRNCVDKIVTVTESIHPHREEAAASANQEGGTRIKNPGISKSTREPA